MAIPFDQAFKLVHDDNPRVGMAAFLGIPLSAKMEVAPLDRELNLPTLRTDQLFRCRTERGEFATHIEALSRFKPEAIEKQFKCALAITAKYDLPLRSHIVLLTDKDLSTGPLPMPKRRKGDLRASLRIRFTKLWEIPARRIFALNNASLLPWTPLLDTRGGDLRHAASRITELNDRELAAELLLLGGLRYGNREALLERINKLMTTEEILQDSVVYQEIVDSAGRKAARRLIENQLVQRFGGLSQRLKQRLASADLATLESWSGQILVAPTADAALE